MHVKTALCLQSTECSLLSVHVFKSGVLISLCGCRSCYVFATTFVFLQLGSVPAQGSLHEGFHPLNRAGDGYAEQLLMVDPSPK